jgi:hypothetical protein
MTIKPQMLRAMRLLSVILAIGLTDGGFAGIRLSQVDKDLEQQKLIAEAKNLSPAVLDAYEKNRAKLKSSIGQPSLVLTVGTKRYNDAYALVALQINTDDPATLSSLPGLSLEVQPVVVTKGQIVKKTGRGITGSFKVKRTGPEGLLHKASFPVAVPLDANSVNVVITLVLAGKPLGIEFRISVSNRLTLGYTGRSISSVSAPGAAANSALLQKVSYTRASPTTTFEACCCTAVAVGCSIGDDECSVFTHCSTCDNRPITNCECPPLDFCGCSIVCDSCTCPQQ